MNRIASRFSVWAAAALCLLMGAVSPLPAAASAAPDRFEVGTLHVQVHGEGGPPLILIPGLGSGGWVWADTVQALQGNHRVYVLTLAGFDSTPAPARGSGLMQQAGESLRRLVEEHGIHKPVLVGHSLGGTLAIGFAQDHPDLVGGVVAVDGMPIFPGFERLADDQRTAAAERTAEAMRGADGEAFRKQQLAYMHAIGVLDAQAAAKYGALQARSKPEIVGGFAAEVLATDLRPGLARIRVPVLAISPYNKADFEAAAASGAVPMMSEDEKAAWYRALLEGTPQVEVVSISPARHFVMLDQPEPFLHALRGFLAALPAAPAQP